MKIALLSLVNDLPEQPSINVSSQHIEAQESRVGRSLAFKHEVSIVQQLADDPLHVLATCIEENISRGCLVIQLAANTGKHKILVDGLKTISRILQTEAINGSLPL